MEIAELVVAPLSLVLDLAPLPLAGFDLAPLLLAELHLGPLLLVGLENLELVLLEAVVLVAIETAHHSSTD